MGLWFAGWLPRADRRGLKIPTPRTLRPPPAERLSECSREGRVSPRLQAPRKEAGCALGGGSWKAPCAPRLLGVSTRSQQRHCRAAFSPAAGAVGAQRPRAQL